MWDKITINTQSKCIIINTDTISYCRSEGSYTTIYQKDKIAETVSKSLKYIEDNLPPDRFCRCHQSYLVNISEINYFDKKKRVVVLESGEEIPVAKRKVSCLKSIILKH